MIDVIKTRKKGIKLIEIKNRSFLLLKLIFILIFFTIIKIIIKKGIKIKNCLDKKIVGFTKCFIKPNSDTPVLFKP